MNMYIDGISTTIQTIYDRRNEGTPHRELNLEELAQFARYENDEVRAHALRIVNRLISIQRVLNVHDNHILCREHNRATNNVRSILMNQDTIAEHLDDNDKSDGEEDNHQVSDEDEDDNLFYVDNK